MVVLVVVSGTKIEETEDDVDSTIDEETGDPNPIAGGFSSTSNKSFKFSALLVAVTEVGELKKRRKRKILLV